MRADVPDALLAIIARLVAKDPAHRFTNTSDLVTALEALPFYAEEQRVAKDILRRLARGYHVPIVETGVLPPLPDARDSRAAAAVALPPTLRRSRIQVALGLGAVVLISGAWFAIQATRAETRAPVASTAAPPAPVPPSPAPDRPQPAATPPRSAPVGPPGRVRMRADPADAVIYIDGRQVGVGTVFDVEVPSGTRRLRIKAPGSATFDTTFHVAAGNTTRLGLITLRDLP